MSQSIKDPAAQRVYNLSPPQYALSNIALRRLKIARFDQLNDPFELLAVDLVDPNLRAGIRAKKEQIDSHEGLICFSRKWHNPLLWSHYADCHRGIALGFDVPPELLTKVRYIAGMEKLKVNDEATAQSEIDSFLHRLRYTKFRDWEYEDEVRQFFELKSLSRQSHLYFVPFSKHLVLREVILGVRCDLPVESVRDLVSDFPEKVHVSKARIAYSKFGVTEDKSYRPAKTSMPVAASGIASLLVPPFAETPVNAKNPRRSPDAKSASPGGKDIDLASQRQRHQQR